MTVAIWAGVMVIGGLGSVARFMVDRAVARRAARSFPFGTLAVNITGAVLLGFVTGLTLSHHAALLAGTAFVGGVHHLLHLDAGDPAIDRGTPDLACPGQSRRQRRAGGGRRRAARPMDCEPAVSDTYLKLTAFFGERQRDGSRFLAESMLDLYAQREVADSVMLRGIASFGPRHVIRSDESLTLSEDPPVAIAAVDTAETIGGLINDVVTMTPRGLITLERARLYTGELPEGDNGGVKLTIYVGRGTGSTVRPRSTRSAICCTATTSPGGQPCTSAWTAPPTVDGAAPLLQREHRRADHVIAVGSAAQARNALPELEALMDQPLVTLERVQVCKRDGELLARPPALPAVDAHGRDLRQKLTIHTDAATHHDGVPIHRALVRRLWESKTVGGATVLRGIWGGFHGDHKPHGDKLIQYGRQVPVTTIVVDTPEVIAQCFDLIDGVTGRHGLVTSEMVPALLLLDGDVRQGATDLADYRY